MKNLYKGILLTLIAFLVFIIYFYTSEKVENRLYPKSITDEFYLNLHKYSDNENCFLHFSSSLIILDFENKQLRTSNSFIKKCNFKIAEIFIYPPQNLELQDLKIKSANNPNEDIKNKLYINTTYPRYNNKNGVQIVINGSDMKAEEIYDIKTVFKIKNSLYNRFRILGGGGIKLDKIWFYYDNSLLGYTCGEGCFSVVTAKEKIKEDSPIRADNYKAYEFENADNIFITFNPKLKKYLFLQKLLDTIVLGLIVILLYEGIFNGLLKKWFRD